MNYKFKKNNIKYYMYKTYYIIPNYKFDEKIK